MEEFIFDRFARQSRSFENGLIDIVDSKDDHSMATTDRRAIEVLGCQIACREMCNLHGEMREIADAGVVLGFVAGLILQYWTIKINSDPLPLTT
jgi:hypothetical protein